MAVSFFSEGVGGFIVAATAAVEHQGHEAAPDHDGKDRSEAHGDPTMFAHLNVTTGVPCGHKPNCGKAE